MTHGITRFEALQRVLAAAGTQEAMAEAFGVSQPAVSGWMTRSKQLPPEHVLTAERLYAVSRHDLRPDIYPRSHMVDHGTATRFFGVDHASTPDRMAHYEWPVPPLAKVA